MRMAKCHRNRNRNDVGSLILDDGAHTAATTAASASASECSNHIRLWSSFSGATFRRKIIDVVSCGGSSRYQQELQGEEEEEEGGDGISSFNERTGNTLREALKDVPDEKPVKIGHVKLRDIVNYSKQQVKKPCGGNAKSEKLSDLLCLVETETEAETKMKVEALEELKRVVKDLQGEDEVKRRDAASNVRLLAKEDSKARVTLAMLGAIPPLVGMVDLQDVDSQIASLYALLNLAIGNDVNKAAIVEAGAIHKMLKLIESPNIPNQTVAEAIVANFLGLSALDSNKLIIGSSGAIPFLVETLKFPENSSSSQSKQDALRALYNLSISPSNVSSIVETDVIQFLLNSLGDMNVSERVLSILSNIVCSPEGRKAITVVPDAFPILVDVLNWTDSPGCQEKVSYILMVMAHKAYLDRQAMIEAGIMSSLLELTLLGSALAQKRASRILECLRVDKGKQVSGSFGGNSGAAVSAPMCGTSSSTTNQNEYSKDCLVDEEDMMSEEKKAVKNLVQQSLQSNMRRIVKRANLPQDFAPSDHFKALTICSTSKSLPF